MINVEITNDTRWPISMDTDAGRVFLTIAEAEILLRDITFALAQYDNTTRRGQNEQVG